MTAPVIERTGDLETKVELSWKDENGDPVVITVSDVYGVELDLPEKVFVSLGDTPSEAVAVLRALADALAKECA